MIEETTKAISNEIISQLPEIHLCWSPEPDNGVFKQELTLSTIQCLPDAKRTLLMRYLLDLTEKSPKSEASLFVDRFKSEPVVSKKLNHQ